VGLITILFALVSLLSFRVRNRTSLELELAPQHGVEFDILHGEVPTRR
jgi:hypothetical protein